MESVFNQLRVPEEDELEAEDLPAKTEEVTNKYKRHRRQLVNYVADLESELVNQV